MSTKLKHKNGTALVEFAIVVTLLFVLVFGIIEFGLMLKDYLSLSQAAREGARSAALGSPTSIVETRIRSSTTMLNPSRLTITLQSRTGDSGEWSALENTSDSKYNNAASGDQVRVSLKYTHNLVTGKMFSWIAGGGTSFNLNTDMVMRRE
ncbi:MAG: TadE/TadG family type IV pilus assembly protein [Armatimonadota bacterium]|jgi:Flp pilus assembly protein TadG